MFDNHNFPWYPWDSRSRKPQVFRRAPSNIRIDQQHYLYLLTLRDLAHQNHDIEANGVAAKSQPRGGAPARQ
jgi:hypothetical protein